DDVKTVPINVSATLLHALHQRMYEALKNLTEADWMRTVFHPGQQKEMTLWDILNLYAWHGKHHVAQINYLREKMKW
ncbi:MAG TPA: DinB family protein, partial [Niabella sp.]|nr:DinB family protein [Niabella sp.]